MAKISDSVLGDISGKIGPVVAYMRNGESVVREHVIPKDPKTPAQLAQRMKLKLANNGLKPLKNQINMGYEGTDFTYRKVVGVTMKENIVGEYPNLRINYSRVKISDGKLQMPDYANVEFDINTHTAKFYWDNKTPSNPKLGKSNDLVRIVLFNEKLLETFTAPKSENREKGIISITIPESWLIEDVHFWLFLRSQNLKDKSDSLYIKLIDDI